MKTLILLLLAVLVLSACRPSVEDNCNDGHKLFLSRGMGIETFRGCIQEPGDCPFIAGILQKAEPMARWYCK